MASSSGSSSSRVSLKGMIQLEQIEDLLTSLQDRIDSQERTIAAMQASPTNLTLYVQKTEVYEKISSINDNLTFINRRLEALEKAVVAKTDEGKTVTCGELASKNSEMIKTMKNTMEDFVRLDYIKEYIDLIEENLTTDIKDVSEKIIPFDDFYKLSDLQSNLLNRCSVLEKITSDKVDKTELTYIETLRNQLNFFNNFKNDTVNDVKELKAHTNKLSGEMCALNYGISSINGNIDSIDERFSLYTKSTKTNEIESIIGTIKETLLTLESKDNVKVLADKVNVNIVGNLKKNNESIGTINENIKNIYDELKIKADIKDMNLRLLKDDYDLFKESIIGKVNIKADNISLDDSNRNISALQANLAEESSKLAVAMRFIDWFVSRGENYEYNMKIIDKHLGNLANAAGPENRQPFSNNVRFNTNTSSSSSEIV